jgi:hypothetical protein
MSHLNPVLRVLFCTNAAAILSLFQSRPWWVGSGMTIAKHVSNTKQLHESLSSQHISQTTLNFPILEVAAIEKFPELIKSISQQQALVVERRLPDNGILLFLSPHYNHLTRSLHPTESPPI